MGKKLFYFLISSILAVLCLGCGAQAGGTIPATHETATVLQPNPTPTFAITTATITKLPEGAAPGSSLTFSQHGLTVTLAKLEISADQTLLYFTAQVDPAWGFTFGEMDAPPEDVYITGAPVITDETGQVYEINGYEGGAVSEKYVDPKTGAAYTGGRYIFEPITGSRLDIAMPLLLMTVRTGQPIHFQVNSPEQSQSLSIESPLAFGPVSLNVKVAKWNSEGSFQLTVDGSLQQGDLRPVCLYLYQDPQWPPASYTGCGFDDNAIVDLQDKLTFEPLPDFSKPVEVGVAANIIFQEPFRFVWIRNQ